MLDIYPDAEPYEPYTCILCTRKCGAIINDEYCMKCFSLFKNMEMAKSIFGSDKSPLDFMVTSGGSVKVAPSSCERCGKKFRFWRKEHIIYDRSEHYFHHWKHVCVDCINLETDSY